MSGANTQNSPTFGGGGGSPFSDSSDRLTVRGKIVQIFIRSGSMVDNITAVFANGSTYSHGGNGGNESVITFDDDEYVSSIKVRSGDQLDQITFYTTKSKTYGPYGGYGGNETTFSFNDFALQYFFGRSGSLVDAIGFAYGDRLPPLAGIVKLPSQGGGGGSPFDDLAALQFPNNPPNIRRIRVRFGSLVDRIEVTYGRGSDATFYHGGEGGSYGPDFDMGENEYIHQVNVRASSMLDAIQFVANTGRQSIWYGGGGGTPATFVVPNNAKICAFYGRSGSQIDAFGVYYKNSK